ncbi:hypothetical protein LCGC14_1672710, partial [marine sediment metagenome]
PAMLDAARQVSEQKGASVQWLCEDMRTLRYADEFDYVCLRDVIFGIFESRQEDVDLLGMIGSALRAGGKFLLEVYNREFALHHGVEGILFYDASVDRFVRRGPDAAALSMRLYSLEELELMLANAGLRIVKTHAWNKPKDPAPPPWRADLIVAQKDVP